MAGVSNVDCEASTGVEDVEMRVLGLEYALDESVPMLVGALVSYLARKGFLDLAEFEKDLRDDFNPDLRIEDSTGAAFAALARLVAAYRQDGVTGSARYSPVYATTDKFDAISRAATETKGVQTREEGGRRGRR